MTDYAHLDADPETSAALIREHAPRTAAVIGAEAWDRALAAVASGVRSAKNAHAERGHRNVVSALVGLELAIPDTENPYRTLDTDGGER